MSYYQNNKVQILNQQKEYRNRVDVKEFRNNQKKQYYQSNKDQILDYNRSRVECSICNCSVSKRHLARHKQTNKHTKNLNNN